MQTELKGGCTCGFRLSEKDFRRILDLVTEKIKTGPDQKILRNATYRLVNGAIINTENFDDFFSEENVGTKRIVNIKVDLGVEGGMSAEIKFVDLISEREEKNSIFYKLQGEQRDPLFVLASELDERIKYIQRINMWPERPFEFFMLFLMLMMFVFVGTTFFSLSGLLPRAESVIAAYKAGRFAKDIPGLFEYITQLDEARFGRVDTGGSSLVVVGGVLFIPAFGIATWYFLKTFLYPFNFVWGEYITVIEKRDRTKNFLLIGIGIAMVIGVISSYVAGLIPKI